MNGKRRHHTVWYLVFGLMFALGALLLIVSRWYATVFDTGLRELLYTVLGPLEGTSGDVVKMVIGNVLPPFLGALLIFALLGFLCSETQANQRLWTRNGQRPFPRRALRWLRRAGALGCAGVLGWSLHCVNVQFDVAGYLHSLNETTYIYEVEYADPAKTVIRAPEKKRNLIHIYLESMESTYLAKEDGGWQRKNMLPGLTRLAEEYVHFAGPDNFSGMRSLSGASWTMGSLLAQTAGIPFAFPVEGNAMDTQEHFAPRLKNLGDILQEHGYVQEFLCGSDASFGGRRKYFTQHGGYQIYDLFTAREQGVVEEDYFIWWGFEDFYLFDIARKEAERLAQEEQPFNLTLLTVDLHHPGGYFCDACDTDYSGSTGDVVRCTDRQVEEFIRWCQEQPFYEDTVIVVTGDHPRMDLILVEDAPEEIRTMVNLFVNPAAEAADGAAENRVFTALDVFPTTLAAMGFDIEGDKLGLGVNLFSGERTLAERVGLETLNAELSKQSEFYLQNFYYAK